MASFIRTQGFIFDSDYPNVINYSVNDIKWRGAQSLVHLKEMFLIN